MNSIAQTIENEMKLLTTPQKLYTLRKSYSDEVILLSLYDCSRGNREAIGSLINKHYCGNTEIIERDELVDADIIEEMQN
jgi:hypothetical protein